MVMVHLSCGSPCEVSSHNAWGVRVRYAHDCKMCGAHRNTASKRNDNKEEFELMPVADLLRDRPLWSCVACDICYDRKQTVEHLGLPLSLCWAHKHKLALRSCFMKTARKARKFRLGLVPDDLSLMYKQISRQRPALGDIFYSWFPHAIVYNEDEIKNITKDIKTQKQVSPVYRAVTVEEIQEEEAPVEKDEAAPVMVVIETTRLPRVHIHPVGPYRKRDGKNKKTARRECEQRNLRTEMVVEEVDAFVRSPGDCWKKISGITCFVEKVDVSVFDFVVAIGEMFQDSFFQRQIVRYGVQYSRQPDGDWHIEDVLVPSWLEGYHYEDTETQYFEEPWCSVADMLMDMWEHQSKYKYHVQLVGDVNEVMNTSEAVYGPELLKGEKMKELTQELASRLTTKFYLTPSERLKVAKYLGAPVSSSSHKSHSSDHVELIVARELVGRRLLEAIPDDKDFLSTLHVGATYNNFSMWRKRTNHSFYIHGTEAKDVGRNIAFYNYLGSELKAQKLPSLRATYGEGAKGLKTDFKGTVKLINKMARREQIVMQVQQADVLIFQDVIYGVTEVELCQYFERTKAKKAYATMFLPNCFYGDNAFDSSPLYRLEREVLLPSFEDIVNVFWPEIILFIAGLEFVPGTFENWCDHGDKNLLNTVVREFHDLMIRYVKSSWHHFKSWVEGVVNSPVPVEALVGVDLTIFKFRAILGGWFSRFIEWLRMKFGVVRVAWRDGFQNGYAHNETEWKKWATQRVYRHENVQLTSQIMTRYGEMVLIEFHRTDVKDTVVHSPASPLHLKTMRIWDWAETLKANPLWMTGKIEPVWTYCNQSDFYEVYSWALAEPEDSLDFSVVMTACNRTRRGLSLVSSISHEGLNVTDKACANFALCVYLAARRDLRLYGQMLKREAEVVSRMSNFEEMLKTVANGLLFLATGGLVVPALAILEWLLKAKDRFDFIEYAPEPKTIKEFLRTTKVKVPREHTIVVPTHGSDSSPATSCMCCSLVVNGNIEGQTFAVDRCTPDSKAIEFGMSAGEATAARAFMDQAIDHHRPFVSGHTLDGAKAMESWLSTVQTLGTSHHCSFHIIKGGPGTGKSFMARELAYTLEKQGYTTKIYLPLANLKEDYDKAIMSDGVQFKFNSDTWFKTSRDKAVDVLLVDEFTLVDSCHFKAYVNYVGAQHVFLIGDEMQQHKSPDVSIYPGIAEAVYWPSIVEAASRHELQRNFRFVGPGAAYRVKWLNYKFGYRMYTTEKGEESFPIVGQPAFPHLRPRPDGTYVFSHATAQDAYGVNSSPLEGAENHSVYSSQGVTVDTSTLAIYDRDRAAYQRHGAVIVALTRSKHMPTIVVHDPNADVLRDFLIFSGIDDQDAIRAQEWPKAEVKGTKLEALAPHLKEIDRLIHTQKPRPVDPVQEEKWEIGEKKKIVFEDNDTETQREIEIAINSSVLDLFDTCTYDALPKHLQSYFITYLVSIASKSTRVEYKNERWRWRGTSVLRKAGNRLRVDPADFKAWLLTKTSFVWLKPNGAADVYDAINDPWDLILDLRQPNHVRRLQKSDLPKVLVKDLDRRTKSFHPWDRASTGHFYIEYVAVDGVITDPGLGYMPPGKPKVPTRPPSILTKENPLMPSEFQTFSASPWRVRVDNQQAVDKRFISKPSTKGKLRLGKDNYRFADLVDSSGGLETTGLQHTSVVGSVLKPPRPFTQGFKMNLAATFFRRTRGGKISRRERAEQRALLPGSGNLFTGETNETLRALQRVCGKRPSKGLSAEGFQWFEKHMTEAHQACHKAKIIDILKINRVTNQFWRAAQTRNYLGRTMAERKKHQNILTKRVTNKVQYKPMKDGKIDNTKTGQTITTTSPYWNLIHGAGMRVVNLIFKETLQDDVFYDSYENASDFKIRMTEAIRRLPVGVQYGIVDGEEFDAGQTHGTMVAEMIHRRLSGIGDRFVKSYYRIRKPGSFVYYGFAAGKTKYEKGSGFSDTLLGNTTLEQMVGHHAIVGVGPRVLGLKGDDFLKVQFNLSRNHEFIKSLQMYSNLKLKVEISNKGGEFIGCTVGPEGMFTSIPRVALKAVANRFRNYTHFTEYQKSLREKILEIKEAGVIENIYANMNSMGLSKGAVETCLGVIDSISHIDEAIFLRYFAKRKFHSPPPPSYSGRMDVSTFSSF